MRMEISCPGSRPVVSHHAGFYEIYENALAGLRPSGDGQFRSDAERTAPGEAGSTTKTTHLLTVQRAKPKDCLDLQEARTGPLIRDPFPPNTAAEIAPSCDRCPKGIWRLRLANLGWRPQQTEAEKDLQPSRLGWLFTGPQVETSVCLHLRGNLGVHGLKRSHVDGKS